MAKKSEYLVLARVLQKLAPRVGARVVLEPEWKIAGQLTFKNGKKSYFRYNSLDLNPVGASDIAKDKDYASYFMKRMGYPTVQGESFYSDEWCAAIGSKRDANAACRFARTLGYPVIAKPNSGSQGSGVTLVYDERSLRRALREIFKKDRIALVQRPVQGRDYRIVVLDDEVISVYERIPLNVLGDGRSTVEQLLKKKQREFDRTRRDTQIKVNDPRIAAKLRHAGMSLSSVPAKSERVYLLDNANLSTGGDALDVTDALHPSYKKMAIELTRDMGLRLCGVDIMVSGDISKPAKRYRILEINAAPGLDHYVKQGAAQQRIVEALYMKVLRHLSTEPCGR